MRKISSIYFLLLISFFTRFIYGFENDWQLVTVGENFNKVYFIDNNTGFYIGDSGVLLKSTNIGANWSFRNSGTLTYKLTAISFGDYSNGWIVGSLDSGKGCILHTTDGGENWSNQFYNQCLYTVKFLNVNTGWMGGRNGLIRRTTNGGVNWITQITNTNKDIADIYFVDSMNGWAVGGNNYSDTQLVLRTTNGGTNWILKIVPDNYYKQAILFVNSSTGFICGRRGNFNKTTDGGATWSSMSIGNPGTALFSVYFVNQNTGWVCGAHQVVYKTTDSGNNWHLLDSGILNDKKSIFFINEQTGFTAGYITDICGAMKRTTNGGTSWSTISNGPKSPIKSIALVSGDRLWAAGTRCSINSTDGGITWSCSSPYTSNLRKVYFRNGVNGMVVGGPAPVILRTTTGGLNWNGTYFGSGYFCDVYISNSNIPYIIGNGSGGYIGRLSSMIGVWEDLFNLPNVTFNSITFVENDTTGWVIGSFGTILKTTNQGNNWIIKPSPITKSLNALYFLDKNTGWIVGDSGTILKTENCENWQNRSINSTKNFQSIIFVNQTTGWIVGSEGTVLYTTNTGSNWNSIENITQYNLYDIKFINPNTGWIAGDHGTIFRTTNCGGILPVNNTGTNVPIDFSLFQNYPNPFNPSTNIRFSIPSHQEDGLVQLKIYDILGKEITTLVDEPLKAGEYSVQWSASDYPSGIYFYTLTSDGWTETKKMIFIK
jgi:photosystem II stability/assembly factor-like uncharacterized protein